MCMFGLLCQTAFVLPFGVAGFFYFIGNSVSDTKHTVVNFSQSIDILSLYHKGGISNEYKVYR